VAGDTASTVGGGRGDTASGAYATVPGGRGNAATGRYSLAAGRRGKAIHTGAFVWADSQNVDFASTAANQFSIRAQNGLRLADTAGAAKSVAFGEHYRDNGIVAWARVDGVIGILNAEYGVTSIAKNSTGNYTITINGSSAVNFNHVIPIAIVEMASPPTTAAGSRLIYIDQETVNSFRIFITDGTFAAADSYFTFMVTGR
jgi:hypothetical protein